MIIGLIICLILPLIIVINTNYFDQIRFLIVIFVILASYIFH